MLTTVTRKDLEALNDVSLIWTCIGPVIQQVRGKNFTIKSEAYAHLAPGQRALFMFQVLYGHTSNGVEEFYLHQSYLLSQKGVWSQLQKGMKYFKDYAMVRVLEKMETVFQSLQTEEFKENAEQYNALVTEIDKDVELSALMRCLNESFRDALPLSIKLVAAYIRDHAEEFVQFSD